MAAKQHRDDCFSASLALRKYCRQMFGNAQSPQQIWQREFDGNDNALRRLASQDWREITPHDLSRYYMHSLLYTEPLQQSLFDYLFPLCLAVWREELLENRTSHFSDEIYRAFGRDFLWRQMMNDRQRTAVNAFIVDSLIERLTLERGFIYAASQTPAYRWFYALEDLANVLPLIEPIWQGWWTLDHSGKAVSALMYASCLIYLPDENPIFAEWTATQGGGAPQLYWPIIRQNREFLEKTLTAEFIIEQAQRAAECLQYEPEGVTAAHIASDARGRRDVIQLQIEAMTLSDV
jgi:hypothetical protein